MYTYKDLKLFKKKREEFKKLLPFNFASLLYAKYKTEALTSGKSKPKYSYSTIRKVASGERHNEKVLRDLTLIAKEFQNYLKTKKKFKKNGYHVSL